VTKRIKHLKKMKGEEKKYQRYEGLEETGGILFKEKSMY